MKIHYVIFRDVLFQMLDSINQARPFITNSRALLKPRIKNTVFVTITVTS